MQPIRIPLEKLIEEIRIKREESIINQLKE
jgi:hypothetical protein